MKVKIADLKAVVKWMEENSRDVMCNIREIDRGMQITCMDKYAIYVEMKISEEGTMGPKIVKEENLP
jgi:hypothetical protein